MVLSGNCEVAVWEHFAIERTTDTPEGWWIEIPHRNKLTVNVAESWKVLAGPSVDYSDEIRNFWAFSKVLDSAEFMALAIPKCDVDTGSMETIDRIISQLSKTKETVFRKRNTLEIFFPDYDEDPRELFQIPEILAWFRLSLEAGIPWFYFLHGGGSGTPIGLSLLYGCACEGSTTERVGAGYYLHTSPDARADWLKTNFHSINVFCEKNGIGKEFNKKACECVMRFLRRHLEDRPPPDCQNFRHCAVM
ncbi:MAG: chlororespiratory reduction 6 domain-containing protein [Verrucomicrobiae bacterium]|nr:chlororespiratory reduction 6 domain-containing protein [Verrucomicrobiae bacterium]